MAIIAVPIVLIPTLVSCSDTNKTHSILEESPNYQSIEEFIKYNPNVFYDYKVNGDSIFENAKNFKGNSLNSAISLFNFNKNFEVNHDGHIDSYSLYLRYSPTIHYENNGNSAYVEVNIVKHTTSSDCNINNRDFNGWIEVNKKDFMLQTYASVLENNNKFTIYQFENIPKTLPCKLWVYAPINGIWTWVDNEYYSMVNESYPTHNIYLIALGMNPNKKPTN